jgi:hypothetical protein
MTRRDKRQAPARFADFRAGCRPVQTTFDNENSPLFGQITVQPSGAFLPEFPGADFAKTLSFPWKLCQNIA